MSETRGLDAWAVPESEPDDAVRAAVAGPPSADPPWPATVRATLWWHRATREARALAPAGRCLPITLAMVVDYLETPVGPYREVLASPVLRLPARASGFQPAMAVPLIAVDSTLSVHGGRVHWDLPKVLAQFSGDVHDGLLVDGGAWSVRTATRLRGPAFPLAGGLRFAQPLAAGGVRHAGSTLRGRARLATVSVTSSGPTLPGWLRAGTHPGLAIVSGRVSTGPAAQEWPGSPTWVTLRCTNNTPCADLPGWRGAPATGNAVPHDD